MDTLFLVVPDFTEELQQVYTVDKQLNVMMLSFVLCLEIFGFAGVWYEDVEYSDECGW